MLRRVASSNLRSSIACRQRQLSLQPAASFHQVFARPPPTVPHQLPTRTYIRSISTTMASTKSATFTQKVVAAMEKLYPLHLADNRWDNVGLLLDNTEEPGSVSAQEPTVLLTTDLTPDVAEEAIQKKVSVIVTYHPIIFSGLKSITHANPQQSALLLLARKNIAVYAPHTAVDASPNGVNTWLAEVVATGRPASSCDVVIPAIKAEDSDGAGYGRLVTLNEPRTIANIAKLLSTSLGTEHISVAAPLELRDKSLKELVSQQAVNTVAVCAGSGWDVLKGTVEKDLGQGGAEVLVMGECSHHNALMATMKGRWVITVFHSNSERGFLWQRMRPSLEHVLQSEFGDGYCRVLVSDRDRDPFEIMNANGS